MSKAQVVLLTGSQSCALNSLGESSSHDGYGQVNIGAAVKSGLSG